MSLNPGRRHLEAGQTAIVVAASQAAVDAGLHQRFTWPTALPASAPAEAPAEVRALTFAACAGRGGKRLSAQRALKLASRSPHLFCPL